jgi:hypothetical protein
MIERSDIMDERVKVTPGITITNVLDTTHLIIIIGIIIRTTVMVIVVVISVPTLIITIEINVHILGLDTITVITVHIMDTKAGTIVLIILDMAITDKVIGHPQALGITTTETTTVGGMNTATKSVLHPQRRHQRLTDNKMLLTVF